MKQYKQTKKVSWLRTPAGTIWAGIEVDYYIQPVKKSLQDTVMGVNLYLLNNKDREIFEEIDG